MGLRRNDWSKGGRGPPFTGIAEGSEALGYFLAFLGQIM